MQTVTVRSQLLRNNQPAYTPSLSKHIQDSLLVSLVFGLWIKRFRNWLAWNIWLGVHSHSPKLHTRMLLLSWERVPSNVDNHIYPSAQTCMLSCTDLSAVFGIILFWFVVGISCGLGFILLICLVALAVGCCHKHRSVLLWYPQRWP